MKNPNFVEEFISRPDKNINKIKITPELTNLLQNMLEPNYLKRFNIDQVINSQWF